MKLKLFFFGTLMLMLIFSGGNHVTAGQEDVETGTCETPTQFISISADPDTDGSLKFDKTELKVDKNTCVEIKFYNMSPAVEHDFTFDADSDIGIEKVMLHLVNNKDGINGSNYLSANFQTPDVDATVEYYCSITGHKAGGMFGDLVIGESGSLPGFELPLAIVAIFSLIAIPQLRKRK